MKYCLVCEIFFKKLLHNSSYQNFTSFYTQNWLHSIFAAAHDLVKGRRKLKTTRAFLYLINFDAMSKCLQNIASARSLRPFCWYVCLTLLTKINKTFSRRWQNHGNSKVCTPVKVAETKRWKNPIFRCFTISKQQFLDTAVYRKKTIPISIWTKTHFDQKPGMGYT